MCSALMQISIISLPQKKEMFLKALHLEEFVTSVSWGVLHPQLVKEAIASLEPTTLMTTVKGRKQAIIAKDWRKQFQQVFHLTQKQKQPVTKKWTLAELFPSLEEKRTSRRCAHCRLSVPGSKTATAPFELVILSQFDPSAPHSHLIRQTHLDSTQRPDSGLATRILL